ncbi:MAG TPA: dTMP kinase [Acidimicrobiales bacterium]|nr:dTMP kinase [Acidimicrobiales bacterium]
MIGRLIAFEGGEGSGKSTQAARLARRLDAVLTRQPGGTSIGEQIRAILLDVGVRGLDPKAEALLMAADRAQHVRELIRPALARGQDVVSDRYSHSSLAYQGFGRGLEVGELRQLSDWASEGLWPDVVVLLDVPASVAADRLHRDLDRFEQAGPDFHDRVTAGFRALAAEEPERWLVVDGAGGIDEVEARVASAFDEWAARR